MAKLSWLLNRLKAMSIQEINWRLSQKILQKKEAKIFSHNPVSVTDYLFNKSLSNLRPNPSSFQINFSNNDFSLNTSIHLLAGIPYESCKTQWNAGFQTNNNWPDTFSYDLEYKQRDEIGDARTNWELNRHFQFALLAKNYAASGEERFLTEFTELFHDWNERNPFLHGISWTSVMEAAIRCSNWCYAYVFFSGTKVPGKLLEELQTGILNMTDYIARHFSRYSSANNHLIVEAFAIGQTGILFHHQPWIDFSVKILTRELPLQNHPDGVNKEQSLHYQSFYMEAMGLMMRLLLKNDVAVPPEWDPWLKKMSRYMTDCIGEHGETVVFGDDDEGKILDLHGEPAEKISHYQYVLGMMSILLDERYVDEMAINCENLCWLFSADERKAAFEKPRYIPDPVCSHPDGGVTILRSRDRKVLIGIDHGPLGFGSIAAHGHADALSFQLFLDGQPVFVDPGTYIYHCDLPSRNAFRSTRNHNTVCMNEKDQSEMLGAFLWGRRAKAKLISLKNQDDGIVKVVMSHDGYTPIIHTRTFEFDGNRSVIILDELSRQAAGEVNFIFSPECTISIDNNIVTAVVGQEKMILKTTSNAVPQIYEYSQIYGIKQKVSGLNISFSGKCETVITIKSK